MGKVDWESLLFNLIKSVVDSQNKFTRSKLFSIQNIANMENVSSIFGHKKDPETMEMTLQKTLQNMRDKGFVNFLSRGEYELTQNGIKEIEERINAGRKNEATLS